MDLYKFYDLRMELLKLEIWKQTCVALLESRCCRVLYV